MTEESAAPMCRVYTLETCVAKSESVRDARKKLYYNPDYVTCFKVCTSAIYEMSIKYGTGDRTLGHALAMSQKFMALTKPTGHAVICPGCPFKTFWACIAMICFSISYSFHEPSNVVLKDMTACLGLSYSDYTKKFYKRMQREFLMITGWSLYFPTAIDFFDCIKFEAGLREDPHSQFISSHVRDHDVYLIINACYVDWMTLKYSCNAIAVAAIVVSIRMEAESFDPCDGLVEALAMYGTDCEDVASCAELIQRRVIPLMRKMK